MTASRISTVVLRAYVGRAVGLWLVVRLVVGVLVAAAAGQASAAIAPPPGVAPTTIPSVVVLCALLGALDVRVRRERALLGNLGIGDRAVIALFALAAVAGELLLAAVGALR